MCKFGDVNVEICSCEDMEMSRCGDMSMWRFGVIDTANLCFLASRSLQDQNISQLML